MMSYVDYGEILCKRLIQLREESELSLSELAEKTGIGRTTIRDWEIGATLPGARHLIILADYYGVSVDYILGREEMSKLYVGKLPRRIALLIGALIREIAGRLS